MPCDYSKYPKNWKFIAYRIRVREGFECAWCGLPQYAVFYRVPDGKAVVWDPGRRRPGKPYAETYKESRALADRLRERGGQHFKVCVLTVAHLHDPDPMNCSEVNLAALCQRCHNRHDAKMRATNLKARRDAASAQPALIS